MDTSTPTLQDIIKLYQLQPHPEGGFYRETYRSRHNHSTAIYYLLPQGSKSRAHRLVSDEMWHFYLGGPMTLVQWGPGPQDPIHEWTLGPDIMEGERVQLLIPGGCWFGGIPHPGHPYSFFGCTVAPGFKYEDFELGKREKLLKEFPSASKWILELTD